MLENIKPEDILFIDIETVPAAPSFEEMKPDMQVLWEKKSQQIKVENQDPGELFKRAGIYAEFGRIICISAGIIRDRNPFGFRLKSFYGDNEKDILAGFSTLLSKSSKGRDLTLCAHNGKEFDYPYIARRMVINRLPIPSILDNAGKKPWEVKLLDSMDLWKFGDYKSYTSLALLTSTLGIPSPKDDIDGSMVSDVYWKERDIRRIVRYCEKDVLAVAQVILRFMNMDTIPGDRIESVTLFD
ncbi:MAG TPA: 3'-5' exonuclease [Bacteroidales bacterium]|nr:3'-5' exonuclease [Bacteroidales bacterium]